MSTTDQLKGIETRDDLSFTRRDADGCLLNWAVPPLDPQENWAAGIETGKGFFREVVELARNNPDEAMQAIYTALAVSPEFEHGTGFSNRGRGIEYGFAQSIAKAVVYGIRSKAAKFAKVVDHG